MEWSGRSTWFGPTAERTTYLAARGRWAGLLHYPAWWFWFGPDYVPLVLDHLPPEQLLRAGGGVFHARSEEPLDRDQLTGALSGPPAAREPRRPLRGLLVGRREGRAPVPTWLPAELLPVADDSDASLYNPQLIPAATMPVGLRVDR